MQVPPIIVALLCLAPVLTYWIAFYMGKRTGKEDMYDEMMSDLDSPLNKKANRELFIEEASLNIFAARVHGLFQGKIHRGQIAKEAVKDAQALWDRLEKERSPFMTDDDEKEEEL